MITEAVSRHIDTIVSAFPPLDEQERNDVRALMRPAWLAVKEQRAVAAPKAASVRRGRRAA